MDPEIIRRLVRLAEEENIAGLAVERGGVRVSFIRQLGPAQGEQGAPEQRAAQAPSAQREPAAEQEVARPRQHYVKAPMVGIFRRRGGPDEDVAVRVGDEVAAGDVVCYIESMNIMNEVKTDVAGRVVEIAAQDGEPVEYGQPVILIQTE